MCIIYNINQIGLPELSGPNDIRYMCGMLKLQKDNEEDAGNYFVGLINESKNEKFRVLDNIFHNLKHG